MRSLELSLAGLLLLVGSTGARPARQDVDEKRETSAAEVLSDFELSDSSFESDEQILADLREVIADKEVSSASSSSTSSPTTSEVADHRKEAVDNAQYADADDGDDVEGGVDDVDDTDLDGDDNRILEEETASTVAKTQKTSSTSGFGHLLHLRLHVGVVVIVAVLLAVALKAARFLLPSNRRLCDFDMRPSTVDRFRLNNKFSPIVEEPEKGSPQ